MKNFISMKLLYRGMIACSLFLLSACSMVINDVTGSVTGIVKDYTTGQVIENCQVTAAPGGKSVFTGPEGRYTIKELTPNSYTLTFSKIGYHDQTANVEVEANQTITKDIQLEAILPIEFSTQILDFGDYNSTMSFSVKNNTSTKYDISLVSKVDWLSFSQTRATVAANNQLNITAYVDRSLVGYGNFNTTVTIDYIGSTEGNIVMQVKMIKAKESAPVVETKEAYDITASSFKIGGLISATGGAVVTAYGHCWSTEPNPTIDAQHTDFGRTTETVSYNSSINQNLVNRVIYVRAYATNQHGTSYGNEVQVTSTSEEPDDGEFAGGDGTAMDPYLLRSAKHVQNMRNYPSAYFRMIADIDLDGVNWIPFELKGSFDGDNHILYNLTLSPYITAENIGMFTELSSQATLKNLTIEGVEINMPNYSYVGAFAGKANCNITNCHVILKKVKSIVGKDYVGGIVGYTTKDVTDCSVSSNIGESVIVGNSYVGGAVGATDQYSNGSEITRITVNCNIGFGGNAKYGGLYSGGIVGNLYATASNCSYSGTLTALENGGKYFGGIAGAAHTSSYNNSKGICACKANVIIEANDGTAVGGIIGYNDYDCHIRACYSQGEVRGTNTTPNGTYAGVGGITGYSYGLNPYVDHCYTLMNLSLTQSGENISGSFTIKDLVNQFSSPINVAEVMRAANSQYASYWDYDRTWTWTGLVNGQNFSAICPKLTWE